MNEHLQDALKMRQHPEIALKVNSVEIGPSSGGSVKVTANADLSISGQSRSVVINGMARQTATGLVMQGEHKLKMTDYGVKPPSLMLGTMKVKDDVTVGFELAIPAPVDPNSGVALGT